VSKVTSKLILALCFSASAVNAAITRCDDLIEFINTNPTRDYDALDELKKSCASELEYGPTAKLIKVSKGIDLNSGLTKAHNARLDERNAILDSSKIIANSVLHATSSQKLAFSDENLVKQISRFQDLSQQSKFISKKSFYSYLAPPISTALDLCKDTAENNLASEAVNLCKALTSKVTDTQVISDNSITAIDNNTLEALDAGTIALIQLRSGVTNALAQQRGNEILKGLSSVTVEFKKQRAWDLFIIQSGAQTSVRLATSQLNSGQIQRGLSTLDMLVYLNESFLNGLPPLLGENLRKNQSKKLMLQVTKLRDFATSLNPNKVESRLKQYIDFRSGQYASVSEMCKIRFLSKASELDKIDKDLKEINNIEKATNDHKIILYVYSSLAERLDIAIELCGSSIS
jgi:hypothetical protein